MAEKVTKRKAHSDAPALPDFVEPMKAKLVDSMPSGDWIYEIKFDGYRALALRGGSEARVLSRNGKDFGGKFTEVRDSISALDVLDAIIDGEIVALDEKGRSAGAALEDGKQVLELEEPLDLSTMFLDTTCVKEGFFLRQ